MTQYTLVSEQAPFAATVMNEVSTALMSSDGACRLKTKWPIKSHVHLQHPHPIYFDNEYKGSVFLQNVPGDQSLNNHNNER